MKHKLNFNLAITLIIFITLLVTGAVAVLLYYLLTSISGRIATVSFVIISFISSAAFGYLIFWLLSRYVLKPVENIIAALRKVSQGDYSVRVNTGVGTLDIKELEHCFNDMAEELGSNEMFKNDFINNFSHEFKTPIVSIRGFAKQLESDDLDDETRKEYLEIIVSESDRLASMSSNVLLLSKFDNQQIVTDIAKFSLDEQIRTCILILEKSWEEKNIDLDIDMEEITISSNQEMLNHVWINILSNAVKFTPKNGKITVRCYRDNEKNSAIISIGDSGEGMTPETAAHIFDKFYQGDTSHKSKGNGLGLPLAKRITDLCGGNISVKSRLGEGSVFTVRLPLELKKENNGN